MTRVELLAPLGELGQAVTGAGNGIYSALAGVALLVGAVASLIAARRGGRAATEAAGANAAVNRVGDDEPKLRDVVMAMSGKVDIIADLVAEQRRAMQDHLSHHHIDRPHTGG